LVDEKVRSSFKNRAFTLFKNGIKKVEIAILFGVNKKAVSNWFKQYEETGSFRSKKSGVKSEGKKLLSAEQEKQIQKMIVDKMPDQLKLEFSLWTRKAVKDLAEREFSVLVVINTIGDYLRKRGHLKNQRKKPTNKTIKKF
jgi:transposase